MEQPSPRPSSGSSPPAAAADLGATTAPTDMKRPAPAGPAAGGETAIEGVPARPTAPPAPAAKSAAGPPSAAQKVTTLGDFRLVKKLGEGGMGAVFLGEQISLQRPVAIKIMAKHLAGKPELIQRFYREARVMAKLDHPNIVRSFGVGEQHGFHYLAMEFVDGGSVQGYLKKHTKFNVGDSLYIIIACAKALQHAHELTIIHRDIKPDNVLLTKAGGVKLADMGLAKALEEDMSLTQTGMGAGTPFYMAPEQAADAKNVDARSDVYALGCMLYCFLTGDVPFKGNSTLEILKAKEAGTFTPARKINSDVPSRLDLMIDKMIQKKPEFRYQTCAEIVRDLEGLGLASEKLTFLFGETPAPSAAANKAPAPSAAAKASGKSGPPQKPPGAAPSSKTQPRPSNATPVPDSDVWYVSMKNPRGTVVKEKLTTAQVHLLIKSPHFDPEAMASRTADGPPRPLAAYKEFNQAVTGRVAKDNADAKSSRFRNLYKQIAEEEKGKRRWRWVKKVWDNFSGVFALLFWLAILIAGVGLAYYFIIARTLR